MKLSQLAQRKPSHVIVYGDPKTGKSTLAAELTKHGFKLLWFSLDNGHEPLYKLPAEAQGNIEIIVLPDTKEFPIAIDTCLKVISGSKVTICQAHGQCNCSVCKRNSAPFDEVELRALDLNTIVVFDHVSQLADSCMNFVTAKATAKDETYKPDWEDYRVQGTLMSKFFMNIQQAPYNVVCLAHITETVMEDGAKKLVPQIGTTAYSRSAGKYFDHMIYCEVSSKKHRFGSSTTYKNAVVTGSRKDVAIEDDGDSPTLADFFLKPELTEQRQLQGAEGLQQSLAATAENLKQAETVEKSVQGPAATATGEQQEKTPAELARERLAKLGLGKKG